MDKAAMRHAQEEPLGGEGFKTVASDQARDAHDCLQVPRATVSTNWLHKGF